MRIVRSLISIVVLLAAVAAALAATSGWWIDQLARTPEPSEAIIAPIAASPQVTSAVAAQLETMVVAQLPSSVDELPGVRAQVEELISTSIARVLANPDIDQAWRASVSGTRTMLIDDLDSYHGAASGPPAVFLDLRPFMDLVRARVLDSVPERVRPLLEEAQWSQRGRVAVATLDAHQAQLAATTLGLSQRWVIGYVVAGILAVLGLVIGPRRGRWIAWVLASLAGLAAALLARATVGAVEVGDTSTISGAVVGAAGQGIKDSLLAWTSPLPWAFAASAVLGVVALLIGATINRNGRQRR